MTEPNFQSILDKPTSDIKPPQPLPPGTYLCLVEGQPNLGKSSQKQTDFVEYTAKVLQPQPDVTPESIEAAGGVVGKTTRLTYYITDAAVYRLKQFLVESLGIDDAGGTRPLRQMLSEAMGKQVYVKIRHRPNEQGDGMRAEVESTTKV